MAKIYYTKNNRRWNRYEERGTNTLALLVVQPLWRIVQRSLKKATLENSTEIPQKTKRQLAEWEKIFANDIKIKD